MNSHCVPHKIETTDTSDTFYKYPNTTPQDPFSFIQEYQRHIKSRQTSKNDILTKMYLLTNSLKSPTVSESYEQVNQENRGLKQQNRILKLQVKGLRQLVEQYENYLSKEQQNREAVQRHQIRIYERALLQKQAKIIDLSKQIENINQIYEKQCDDKNCQIQKLKALLQSSQTKIIDSIFHRKSHQDSNHNTQDYKDIHQDTSHNTLQNIGCQTFTVLIDKSSEETHCKITDYQLYKKTYDKLNKKYKMIYKHLLGLIKKQRKQFIELKSIINKEHHLYRTALLKVNDFV